MTVTLSVCGTVFAANNTASFYFSNKYGECYYCAYEGTTVNTAVNQLANDVVVYDADGTPLSNTAQLATGYSVPTVYSGL